jgi:hypothetical protein
LARRASNANSKPLCQIKERLLAIAIAVDMTARNDTKEKKRRKEKGEKKER